MSSGITKLEKDEYLFHEGDPSDCMYVIKSGRIAITKPLKEKEIVLAELGPGSMLGEMAFFDDKPRSASAKALAKTSVIALPFKGLHAQFRTFPEWSKAIMRTVNNHLRNANKRIKELEALQKEETDLFPAHGICKLFTIINYVGCKFGKEGEKGLVIASERLRKYTIQVFQEPTHKMQRLIEALQEMNLMIIEAIGDGQQQYVIINPAMFVEFVEWYNKWLFSREDQRTEIEEGELRLVRALLYFARNNKPDEAGKVTVSLTTIQNDSMRELHETMRVDDFDPLIKKGVISEKLTAAEGVISTSFVLDELKTTLPYWEIIYNLRKIKR